MLNDVGNVDCAGNLVVMVVKQWVYRWYCHKDKPNTHELNKRHSQCMAKYGCITFEVSQSAIMRVTCSTRRSSKIFL